MLARHRETDRHRIELDIAAKDKQRIEHLKDEAAQIRQLHHTRPVTQAESLVWPPDCC